MASSERHAHRVIERHDAERAFACAYRFCATCARARRARRDGGGEDAFGPRRRVRGIEHQRHARNQLAAPRQAPGPASRSRAGLAVYRTPTWMRLRPARAMSAHRYGRDRLRRPDRPRGVLGQTPIIAFRPPSFKRREDDTGELAGPYSVAPPSGSAGRSRGDRRCGRPARRACDDRRDPREPFA